MDKNKKILKRARELYNQGKWQEAKDLLNESLTTHDEQMVAEGKRIEAWCDYYIGTKGDENKKIENLKSAEENFVLASIRMREEKGKISILNGLALVYYILGKKEEAWETNNKGIEEFPDEPSIWNTRSILCRWAGEFEESIKVCQEVYETAIPKEDFKMAGHGKHNKGDALVKLGRIEEAKKEYQEAINMYNIHEEKTAESTKFHIEGVEKKLSNL